MSRGQEVESATRVRSLDGLRGLAALVVVLHHVALTYPPLAQAMSLKSARTLPLWVRIVTYSPIHVLWAGTQAVMIFLVLSGYVLTLPFLAGTRRWRPYYGSRLARLYLPVWGALVLGVLAVAIVYPRSGSTGSWWLDEHVGLHPAVAAKDALLIGGTSNIDSPLWSLQWEVIFSLLLPLYLIGARQARTRGSAVVASLGLLAVVAVGLVTSSEALQYLPLFALGALMAAHREDLALVAKRLGARKMAWWSLAGACVIAISLEAMLRGVPHIPVAALGPARLGAALGSVGAVFLAAHMPGFRSLLSTGPAQWLGARSFSLYLTHEPLVVSLAFVVGWRRVGVVAPLCLACALILADVFFRGVEAPSHRLARRIGRRLAAKPASASSRQLIDQ